MLNNGEFLESAEVYGNFMAPQKNGFKKILAGQDIVLEIDCQGAKQVQRIFTRSIGIFILPPSLEALAIRLNSRGQDDPEVIQKRLTAAREEVSHIHDFEYIVINNPEEYALHELVCIIKAERLRKHRQLIKYHALISQLS
jgi:guanylate kinase